VDFDSLLDEVGLDEVVFFELPRSDEAERLWLQLQPTRMAWLQMRGGCWYVAVVLRADPADLASLLREVEGWLADRDLTQLQFELDGRTYLLRGRAPRSGLLARGLSQPLM
jgi:hypothetical protein